MAAIKRTMFLIDGENLVFRYQALLNEGRTPVANLAYEADVFVWNPSLIRDLAADVVRATYYTSVVGDDDRLHQVSRAIQSIPYSTRDQNLLRAGGLYPRVFKKARQSHKSRAVDINITIDALRHAFQNDTDSFSLVTGDSDFLPLIDALMRLGKQVQIYAFVKDIDRRLIIAGDYFIPLEESFFR